MGFIDVIKERAKSNKKTIVLPETEDRRTYEATAQILKEGIANVVLVGSEEEVKKGRAYLIFPEGTRSKMGNRLLDFKGGSFKCAMKAKCPIVPVALIDSYKSFDTNSIEKLTVQVHYLKPLMYEEYKDMKSTEIAALVKKRIEDTIEQYENVKL